MSALIDLTGKKFGRLTVLARAPSRYGLPHWKCRCVCGTKIEVAGASLRYGRTKSCGCLHNEIRRRPGQNRKHGHSYRDHNPTPTYQSWNAMKQRCTNPNNASYRNYGGRGIKFVRRWQKFENFLADMGEKPGRGWAIDRKNSDGPYSKRNCQWLSASDNTRKAHNRRWAAHLAEQDRQWAGYMRNGRINSRVAAQRRAARKLKRAAA